MLSIYFISALVFLTGYDSRSITTNDVCLTNGCKEAAQIITNNMNLYANPCEDFYEFACGRFTENKELSYQLGVNSFSIIREATFEQLRELLTDDNSKDDISPFVMSKQFYKDCLDEKNILAKGLAPIFDKVKQLGGWPVATPNWNEDHFSWIDVVGKTRKMGFLSNFIVSLDVETYLMNSSYKIIYLSPPQLAIPAFSLRRGINDPKVRMYFKLMVALAMKLKISFNKALLELGPALFFETQLAKILPSTIDRKENFGKTFITLTINNVEKQFPFIDWLKFVKAMLGREDDYITGDTTVVLAFPEYLKNLQTLLSQTSDRTLANYFIWRLIFFSMNSYLMLTDQQRWKSCVAITAERFSVPVAAMYVRRHFPAQNKRKIIQISEAIREEIKKTLTKTTWIDAETRKSALEKIESLTTNVAFPDMLLDDEKIVDLYRNIKLMPGHYYESFLEMMRFEINFTMSTLHQIVAKDDWMSFENPLIINAFYSLPENSMKIPAALLQKNIYRHDVPNYLNYGAIGFIISHELSHAFDDQGSAFDKNGNFKNWWDEKTKKEYMKRVQCFVDQYSNYRLKESDSRVNGVTTQGENIADNEGIRQAYNAYMTWARVNKLELKLPGLDFSPAQLFWISAANVWCSKYSTAYMEMAISEDLHAPDRIRIIGSLANQQSFSKDFGCPRHSLMNPDKKCSLWN